MKEIENNFTSTTPQAKSPANKRGQDKSSPIAQKALKPSEIPASYFRQYTLEKLSWNIDALDLEHLMNAATSTHPDITNAVLMIMHGVENIALGLAQETSEKLLMHITGALAKLPYSRSETTIKEARNDLLQLAEIVSSNDFIETFASYENTRHSESSRCRLELSLLKAYHVIKAATANTDEKETPRKISRSSKSVSFNNIVN